MQIEDAPYWNLGNFVPKELTVNAVQAGLHELTRKHRVFGERSFEIRPPGQRGSAIELLGRTSNYKYDTNVRDWHQDDSGNPIMYVMIWSNVMPTEITPIMHTSAGFQAEGTVIKSNPGDLIAFSNKMFKHRTPKMFKTVARMRWFARAFAYPAAKPVSEMSYATNKMYIFDEPPIVKWTSFINTTQES